MNRHFAAKTDTLTTPPLQGHYQAKKLKKRKIRKTRQCYQTINKKILEYKLE